jgi:pimeloyl-ACP methyl ester carboxylesterase
MATIVLVHGAWQTARTWDYVKPMLEDRGHEVIVPVLSGLGQDAANLGPDTSLSQHVDDVCRAMVSKGAQEVLLVGHSYAGMVITGVAEKMPERLARLFYVDAFIPEDRQCAMDLLSEPFRQHFRAEAQQHGGWRLPASEGHLDIWGLAPGLARDFARERLSDFSLRCFEEVMDLPMLGRRHVDCCFLECTAAAPTRAVFAPMAEKARELGWTVDSLAAGHAVQAELPREFADVLTARETPSAHLLG